MSNVLEIGHLTKYYGKVLGVEDLSLTLVKGEIFGFIGPNGAGKSTTIRSIMNLINKTNGTVLMNQQELTKERVDLKEKIGYLPSEIHLYDDFSVKDILDYHESFYKKDFHARRQNLVKRLKLEEKKKIEDLSLGNLKKLGIILALMHEPELLILDEPTSGLDPIMQEVFYQLLLEEKKKGTTIFYSTHILNEISKICDRVGIIKEGHLIKIEEVKQLEMNRLSIVTIESSEVDKIEKVLKITPTLKNKTTIKFKKTMSDDTLIKTIAKYPINHIWIEEATLEELFLHYYQ